MSHRLNAGPTSYAAAAQTYSGRGDGHHRPCDDTVFAKTDEAMSVSFGQGQLARYRLRA